MNEPITDQQQAAIDKAKAFNKGKSAWAHLRGYVVRLGPRNWQARWSNGTAITASGKTMDGAFTAIDRATVACALDVYMDNKGRWKPRFKAHP
jgi:hypothetical protein